MVRKIIVLEDEQTIREETVIILGFEGFEVLSAPNGKLGLDLIREHRPDLILSDILMPIYDGYRVLLEVRSDQATATIPFIFLTAKAERQEWRYGIESGADDYLTKPFTRDELLGAVHRAFVRSDALEQHNNQKLSELRGAITHALPHELRTPLSSILGFSRMLLDTDACDIDDVHELSSYIYKGAQRLHRVVEKVLLSTQIELIRSDLQRLDALRQISFDDPASLIADSAVRQAQFHEREQDLVLNITNRPIHMAADNLQKVVAEITDNAFKFSACGSPVVVTLKPIEGNLLLTVENQGRGLQPDEIQRIGAYIQFDRPLYEQQGLGLGLSIASGLVDLHGGSLTISSIVGQTTTVTVLLALA